MNCTHIDQLPLVMSVEQIADFLGIGMNTAYELVRVGRIKSLRIGHQYRISKFAILEFIGLSAA